MDLELHWLDQPLTWLYWTGLHVTGWKLIGYTGALMFGRTGWSSSSPPSAPANPSSRACSGT